MGTTKVSDDWLRTEYSFLLDEIDSDPLWCGQAAPETYRLLVLPTRAPATVVTATRTDDGWRMRGAQYVSRSEGLPSLTNTFRVDRQTDRLLSEVEFKKLLDALDTAKLWNTRTLYTIGGADGVAWSIEGRRNGQYSIITEAWGQDDAFATAARLFMTLSGLDVPPFLK